MKHFLATITLSLSLFALFSSCSHDELDVFSTIYGMVSDNDSGASISGATVILSPSGKTHTTGSDGMYKFSELEERQYTITVQKNGYSTNRKNVTIGSDEKIEVNISITKL